MTTALPAISPRWFDLCIVAASGPSLTAEVAQACRGHRIIAVNDARRLLPFADVLYACDEPWWDYYGGCPDFAGEKWSSHHAGKDSNNDKIACAARYGLKLVQGADGDGFSLDPARIHYGGNSGHQAANLAFHFLGGKGCIILVGFDMQEKNGKKHFFGDHPQPLNRGQNYASMIARFGTTARKLPQGIEIINATPGSALKCFPQMPLADALAMTRMVA